MNADELQARRQAAEELGLTTTEPIYYEAEIIKEPFGIYVWEGQVWACSLDGKRKLAWQLKTDSHRRATQQSKRWANKLAKTPESNGKPHRAWVGDHQ